MTILETVKPSRNYPAFNPKEPRYNVITRHDHAPNKTFIAVMTVKEVQWRLFMDSRSVIGFLKPVTPIYLR